MAEGKGKRNARKDGASKRRVWRGIGKRSLEVGAIGVFSNDIGDARPCCRNCLARMPRTTRWRASPPTGPEPVLGPKHYRSRGTPEGVTTPSPPAAAPRSSSHPRSNAQPCKETTQGAAALNETLGASRRPGRAETKLHSVKFFGQRRMARDVYLQVSERHVRIAILKRMTAPGIHDPQAMR